MPYRNRATVESWLNDWRAQHGFGTEITVLDDSFQSGENSAVVVVSLRSASTITHLRPVPREGGPCWVATFEPREELVELDQLGLSDLADDVRLLSALLFVLQSKTDAAREQ